VRLRSESYHERAARSRNTRCKIVYKLRRNEESKSVYLLLLYNTVTHEIITLLN